MAKAKRWYAQPACSMTGGAVTVKKRMRTCLETDWVCFLQKQSEQPALNLSRTELIALLPELVWAAELLNAVAIPNENTVPMVKRQLGQADKIVRRARDLLAKEPELPAKGRK